MAWDSPKVSCNCGTHTYGTAWDSPTVFSIERYNPVGFSILLYICWQYRTCMEAVAFNATMSYKKSVSRTTSYVGLHLHNALCMKISCLVLDLGQFGFSKKFADHKV